MAMNDEDEMTTQQAGILMDDSVNSAEQVNKANEQRLDLEKKKKKLLSQSQQAGPVINTGVPTTSDRGATAANASNAGFERFMDLRRGNRGGLNSGRDGILKYTDGPYKGMTRGQGDMQDARVFNNMPADQRDRVRPVNNADIERAGQVDRQNAADQAKAAQDLADKAKDAAGKGTGKGAAGPYVPPAPVTPPTTPTPPIVKDTTTTAGSSSTAGSSGAAGSSGTAGSSGSSSSNQDSGTSTSESSTSTSIPTANPRAKSAPKPSNAAPKAAPVKNPFDDSKDKFSNEDLSKKGYMLVNSNVDSLDGKTKKWRKIDKKADEAAMLNADAKRAEGKRAVVVDNRFSTTLDTDTGKIIAYGNDGDFDQDYVKYSDAFDRQRKFAGSDAEYAADRKTVEDYTSKNSRGTQWERDQQTNAEKAGLTQAGRYVGPVRQIDIDKKEYKAAKEKEQFDKEVAATMAKWQKTGVHKFPTP